MLSAPVAAKEIFLAALDQSTSAMRLAYLDAACSGDDELRRQVEILLAAHDEPDARFDQPPRIFKPSSVENLATIDHSPTEAIGSLIGPHKLLEQIGEGGMGLVYMAEQQRPVRRLVALKLIKPGMDTKQVIARFEAERQALAMMDHPSIAKVLDAGMTEGGRPFFVMELVRGIPINEFCDHKRFTVRQRLELFIQVCQAVQHAHQKGIIHRDLKPTNVLVTMHDSVAVPKVIDFGIAKALGHSLTDHTLHTGFAQLVGTPLYMSPEQAELNAFGVDTRSDVYSLGVMLYELLTDTTPFDKDRLKSAGFDEMRRIIREEEPETVSTRLAKTRNSKIGARSHAASVPRCPLRAPRLNELDWIVARSLEKDRSRRYESASAFAADVQRYLNDEPVHACPPSRVYGFRKWSRKHRLALTTAALVAASLLLGTAASAWQAIEANAARQVAQGNLELATQRLTSEQQARREADIERERAERERRRAESERERAESERRRAESERQRAESERDRAEAHVRQVEEQRTLLESNQRTHALVVDEILTILRTVTTDDAMRHQLVIAAMARLGDLNVRERVTAFRRLGNILVTSNQYSEGLIAYKEALILDPSDASTYVSRGDAYFRRGEFQKAAEDYTSAIKSRSADDPTNTTELPYCRRAFALYRLRRYQEAGADFHRSYDAQPDATRLFVGRQFTATGGTVFSTSVVEEIREPLLALVDRWFEDQKRSNEARLLRADFRGLFKLFDLVAEDLDAIERSGGGSTETDYRRAVLAVTKDDLPRYRQICATVRAREPTELSYLGGWTFVVGPGGLDDYAPAIAAVRGSVAKNPNSSRWLMLLGALLFRAGQFQEASQALQAAIDSKVDIQGAEWQGPFLMAITQHRLGRTEEARQTLQRASVRAKIPLSVGSNWRFEANIQNWEREATQLINPTTPESKK